MKNNVIDAVQANRLKQMLATMMSKKQKKNTPKSKYRGLAKGKMHPHIFLHPRLSTNHFTTPVLAATPYTVIRDKVVVPFALTPTSGLTVLLLGSWQQSAATASVTPLYGVYGSGASVPGTTESTIVPILVTPSDLARARLHRLSARIVCTGGTTAGVAIPDGRCWFGTLRGNVDRTAFASWTSVANWSIGRNELVERTNYENFCKPAHLVTSPNDFLSWESFKVLGGAPTTAAFNSPDLNTMVIVFGIPVNNINVDVQIDAEWTMEYTANAVLQSTHKRHQSAPEAVWHEARGFISDHGGQLAEGIVGAAAAAAVAPEAIGGLGARAAVAGVARLAGRALPGIG